MELVSADRALLDRAALGDAALGEALGCAVAEGWEAFPGSAASAADALRGPPEPVAWGASFFVVPSPRTLIGLGGYRGPPRAGAVEIGYGLAPAFEGRGLATEAAAQLVARAFLDPAIDAVIAHTLGRPGPSARILEKLGFERAGDVDDPEDGLLWRFRRPRSAAERFLGTWALVPDRGRHAYGAPPRDAVHTLAAVPGGVAFTLSWTDAGGAPRTVAFTAPFGEADGFRLHVDGHALRTWSAGGVVTHTCRTLSADGDELEILHAGARADGAPFENVTVYRRVSWSPRPP